jgi:transposase-like protein
MTLKWTMPIRDWKAALNRFAIEFDRRFPVSLFPLEETT